MEENKNSSFNWVNIKFDASKPPEFKEDKKNDIVLFGVDQYWRNKYPDYIENLFERANKHSSLLRKKVFFISGGGITIDESGLTVAEKSVFYDKLKNSNKYGESINDIAKKVTDDYEKHNGAYVEVNWSPNGKNFEITHIPFKMLRISKDKKKYYYSKDWSVPFEKQVNEPEKTGFKEISVIDFNDRRGKQIYALKAYHAGIDYYPLPNYLGVIPYAESEYEIANYHLKSIKSGFHIGTIISFIGDPTQEQKDKLEKELKEKFQGTDMAGSLLLMFSRDENNRPKIERLSPDELDKKFEILSKTIKEELSTAHQMMYQLAGFTTDGMQIGRNEYDIQYEIFKNTYARPRQTDIENWLNKLYEHVGFGNRLKFKELRPVLPFDFKDIIDKFTEDEIREMAGAPPKKKVQQTLTGFSFSSHEETNKVLNDAITLFEFAGETKELFEIFDKSKTDTDGFYSFAKDKTGKEKEILSLLKKDPLMSNETIAELLNIKESDVSKTIDNLIEDGYLKPKEVKSGEDNVRKLNPTKDGIKEADGAKIDEYEIRYSYELDPEASNQKSPILPTSHEFCIRVYNANKLYTRAEIESMSARLGYNVWEMRGGWQTIKGTNDHVPHCRHVWQANKVKRK